jgi:signal transduction histidine kinase
VGQGTGLGLSIVKGILDDHDATIEITSEIGQGTTFLLSFPL